MKLYHQVYIDQRPLEFWPADQPLSPMIIIPGLFGSTGNWRGFAKKMSEFTPVIVVDQRNHGRSGHAPENSYFDLVEDLLSLLDDLSIDRATLCGHSMGGKTAMLFALTNPRRIENLIVLDIAPTAYSHSHAPILRGLKQVDLEQSRHRADIELQLQRAIPDKSTRLFIMLSLGGKTGAFFWRLNVDALLENLPLIGNFPDVASQNYAEKTLFIRGENSDYILDEHRSSIKKLFPRAEIETVNDAGHWVHIDQPEMVLAKIDAFLRKREKNDRSE